MSSKETASSLGRTLGLLPALTIGVGTMVGAGIFIFPGLAAGESGPAAILSFLICGLVALVIALCTAELVTSMPKNGGAYYFISRSIGVYAGVLSGIGQWIGLIFAAAFYLAGFGEYTIKVLDEVGWSIDAPKTLIALGCALLLTGVNLLGTKGAGKLQNGVVLILTAILSVLFFYGVLKALGLGNSDLPTTQFAPKGTLPIFSTAALIFTSYLGFAQIATVAGEVREPQRNLPRALIGSVLIVTLLYCLAVFVSTEMIHYEELGAMGETAMVEVARKLAGDHGALALLFAGLLATLSSANASILSSSRAAFALGKDRMVPKSVGKVNDTFNTPHIALLLTGLPIALITLYDKIEILAEVASFLHLILYAGICVSLWQLKRRGPIWFRPTFRIGGGAILPIIGTLASVGLIAFMEPLSISIGVGLMILSSAWYFIHARKLELSTPEPPHIAPALRSPKVVVPMDLEDPKGLPLALIKAFEHVSLHVLGYRILNEQLSHEQAEEKYKEEAESTLKELTSPIQDLAIDSDTDLLFTQDYEDGLSQYLKEEQFNMVLTARKISEVKRILVPIYDRSQINKQVATVVQEVASSRNIPVVGLILSREEEENASQSSSLERAFKDQLELSGISSDDIQTHSVDSVDILDAILQTSDEDDIVVAAEVSSQERGVLMQRLHREIRDELTCPVLMILTSEKEHEA